MPEETKLTSEEELTILNDKLMGNQAFATCRGKLGRAVITVATNFITETESPTGFLGEWDDFFGKARVMTNLLAQFHRDGLNLAYEELLHALQSKTHFFPGETVPIEQTRPVTVLMLEPEKTMLLLKWLLEEHWMTLRSFLQWKNKETISHAHGGKIEEPSELTERLYAEFPTLETLAYQHWNRYEGHELSAAYKQTVTNTFSEEVLRKGNYALLERPQWNDHIEGVGHVPFVYVFEMEQSDVLKMFSREDQKRIATWQFNVPKVVKNFFISLHPEEIHGEWEKSNPTFGSRGISHGLAGMVWVQSPVEIHRKSDYPVSWQTSGEGRKYGIVFEPRQRESWE